MKKTYSTPAATTIVVDLHPLMDASMNQSTESASTGENGEGELEYDHSLSRHSIWDED